MEKLRCNHDTNFAAAKLGVVVPVQVLCGSVLKVIMPFSAVE